MTDLNQSLLNFKHFSLGLIEWYEVNKRDLPWRNTRNPYYIWLSEIILQQTRVNQGLPYYLSFVNHYPTINSLAKAEEKEVLRLWQGLGYYSRARNMHYSAKLIEENLGGIFPNNYLEIIKLKGIGKYTAAAIASFAFQEVVPVVDGNVFRVLSRIYGIYDDIGTSKGQKVFLSLAAQIIPRINSDIFNQAIMEFGATICLPKPLCSECIFANNCFAYNNSATNYLPVKNKRQEKKVREFTYFVIKKNKSLLLHERKDNDIWKGLYQFYLKEGHAKEIDAFLPDELIAKILSQGKVLITEPKETYIHILTHQQIKAQYWELEIQADEIFKLEDYKEFNFFTLEEIDGLPKPILLHKYLKKNYF